MKHMKRLQLAVASVALALLLLPALAAAGTQDFTLVNKTGVDIAELYISSASTDEWEEDVLGLDLLEDGESVEITFSADEKAKLWDLKVVDGEGDEIVWTDLKLNEISRVTLRFDGNGDPIADIQ
jgi:hypothetical protein